MDEGTEAEPITPAAGEVRDVDVGIAGSLPLAPDQQSFLGRQQGCADTKLFLEGQDSGSPCRGGMERGVGCRGRRLWEKQAGHSAILLPHLEAVWMTFPSEHLTALAVIRAG